MVKIVLWCDEFGGLGCWGWLCVLLCEGVFFVWCFEGVCCVMNWVVVGIVVEVVV